MVNGSSTRALPAWARRLGFRVLPAAGGLLALAALGLHSSGSAMNRLAPSSADEAFVTRSGSDTLAIERFSRSPSRLQGVVELAALRENYVAVLSSDGSVRRFEVDVRPGSTARDTPPLRRTAVTFRGDSAITSQRFDGIEQTNRVGTGRGALPYLKLSGALLEQASLRARALGGDRVELPLLDVTTSRAFTAVVARIAPDSVTIALNGIEVRAWVDSAGRILDARDELRGLRIERVEASAAATLGGHDYGTPPGAPYTAEDVYFRSSSRYLLAGTLTLPERRARPVPAVVLVSGSGPQDRDATYLGSYRPFRQIADSLSRAGMAVLRTDDRGVGASGGNFSKATSADFADDVRAALEYLRTRPEIDGRRLSLLGESEGGLIAIMVAATDPTLRGVVLMGTPSRNGHSIVASQVRYRLERDGNVPLARREAVLDAVEARNDSLARWLPWLKFILDYDPLPTAKRVEVPVLILQGAADHQVTPNQAGELGIAFRSGGNQDVTIRIFPYLNHLFLDDPDGDPEGYVGLASKAIPPEVLGTIADWTAAHLR